MKTKNTENERNRELLQEIADALRTRGYDIAETISGVRVEEPLPTGSGAYKSMAILVPARPSVLSIKMPFQRWAYLADLWIECEGWVRQMGMGSERKRDAKPDEHWILHAYGSNQLERVQKLGEELAKPYGVDITTWLANDAGFRQREQGPELHWPTSKRQFYREDNFIVRKTNRK